MRLNLTFKTESEWNALRHVVEGYFLREDPEKLANTYRMRMTKGDRTFTVSVVQKVTSSGFTLVAKENDNDDADRRPGSRRTTPRSIGDPPDHSD